MTDHPITPPPELIEKWHSTSPLDRSVTVATQAARWGADQELKACLEWFSKFYRLETWMKKDLERFRDARRPKPPSNKEQALSALSLIMSRQKGMFDGKPFDIIRKALEALPE